MTASFARWKRDTIRQLARTETFSLGGERQRISIARAILKNSPILLLDEATASLDIENELAVKQAIANLLKEKKTVVMIAHTLSIVKNADQILVVSDGKIAEAGTHDELLAKGGKYAAMWTPSKKFLLIGGNDETLCVRGRLFGGYSGSS